MWVTQRINIYDTTGKKRGYVRLAACFTCPGDVDAFRRDYKNFMSKVIEKITPICARGGLTAEGTAKSASDSATLMEAEKMLHDNLNRIFHSKVYEANFTNMKVRPFALLKNGTFYCEQVLTNLYEAYSIVLHDRFGR